jgi:hypothetical protein
MGHDGLVQLIDDRSLPHVTNDLRHDIADSRGGLVWGITGKEQNN